MPTSLDYLEKIITKEKEVSDNDTIFDKMLEGLKPKLDQVVRSEAEVNLDIIKGNIITDARSLGIPALDFLHIGLLQPVSGATLNIGPPILLPNRIQESTDVFEEDKEYWGCEVPVYNGNTLHYCIVLMGNADTTVILRQEGDGYDPTILLWRSYCY